MKPSNPISKTFLLLVLSFIITACSDSDNNNNGDSDQQESIAEIVTNMPDDFSTLLAALQTAELDGILAEPGTYTVFAPTNAAFAKLGDEAINALLSDPEALSDILLYHVIVDAEVDSEAAAGLAGSTTPMANGDQLAISISGSDLLLNFSTVISPDVMASNGIIHVIDTVLIPPKDVTTSDTNILETARAAGFDTLVLAAGIAGLEDTLENGENLTVFAPTEEAFAALPPGLLEDLVADPAALEDVLLRHVIGSEVNQITALSLNGQQVATAGGEEVTLQIIDGTLKINNATVTVFDIYASNGIIHVIDAVILSQ